LGAGKLSFGGKGLTIAEVLSFLKGIIMKRSDKKNDDGDSSRVAAGDIGVGGVDRVAAADGVGVDGLAYNQTVATGTYSMYSKLAGSTALRAVVTELPLLLDGYALGIAFLECIISSGGAPSSMHDEFIQLLLEAIRHYVPNNDDYHDEYHHNEYHHDEYHDDHSITKYDLTVYESDTEVLRMYKIYRKKLQMFLLNSTDYHPQRLLSSLPPHDKNDVHKYHHYLYELALVSSRIGEHSKVMDIYINKLADVKLAELYCERIYTLYRSEIDDNNNNSSNNNNNSNNNSKSRRREESAYVSTLQGLNSAGDIYLILFQVTSHH